MLLNTVQPLTCWWPMLYTCNAQCDAQNARHKLSTATLISIPVFCRSQKAFIYGSKELSKKTAIAQKFPSSNLWQD